MIRSKQIAVKLLAAVVAVGGCFATTFGDATGDLRGYGKITSSEAQLQDLTVATFSCDSPGKAVLLANKFGRDMALSATVASKWVTIKIGGVDATVLVRENIGAFLPAAIGSNAFVWTSSKTTDLDNAFAPAAGKLKGATFYDPAFQYPVFYDKFSNAGIGSWYPSYWGSSFTKGKNDSVDADFAYAKSLDLTVQPGGEYWIRNLMPKLQQYGRPYHLAQWHEWSQELAIMAPDELVSPGPDFTSEPDYYGQISSGGHALMAYRNWSFAEMMRQHIANPLLVDWVDPNGEVGPNSMYYFWDFSEANRQNLVRYLKDACHYTLESLGTAWYGDAGHYKSWDDVKIPMGYDFFGYGAGDILANKSWRIHPGSPDDDKTYDNGSWSTLSPTLPKWLRHDIANGYQRVDFNDSGWPAFDRPGGELPAIYFGANASHFNSSNWHRGSVDVPADWLEHAKSTGRVYLSVISLTANLGSKSPDRMWVNGIESAAISAPPGGQTVGQIDVTDAMKPGSNLLVQLSNAAKSNCEGPIFLTTRKLERYPFADPTLNARYHDWHAYPAWCVNEKMENTYKAMRAVDPVRPIKMMAASYKDLSIDLCDRYGCYPHNTGEGAFFRPWDKRYGYVYGIPSSAEFASGITKPDSWKRWLGWFMFEGNNALDNFHDIQEMMYSPVKDLWVQYMPYLRLANRSDFVKPKLALFRSSQSGEILPQHTFLSLDLGRGDLQFIGQSYVYIDEIGLQKDKLKDYPVIFDCGTWIMNEATVAGLKKYVEDGGTFVAMQETGRHTFTHRDAWPITDLTGFKVREVRPMTGNVTILADQPLFKQLAGQNLNNRGKSIDYSEYNFADKCVALEATAPDTIPIARYDDGSIAIGMRKLGKGKVIVLGSPFWRDSYDKGGMWWPGESQSVFLDDLFDGLGIAPVAKSDTHDVWREQYTTNNGTEAYLTLFNPFDTAKTFNIDWTTAKPVASLYDPATGQPVSGTISGHQISLKQITLAPLETKVVAAAMTRPPEEAVNTWFDHLVLWTHPSAPGETATRPDLPFYNLKLAQQMTGKESSVSELATLDVPALSKMTDPGAGFTLWKGQSIEEANTHPDENRRYLLHASLKMPPKWKPADRIELVLSGALRQMIGKPEDLVDAYVNGQKVMSQVSATSTLGASRGSLEDGAVADIGKALDFNGPISIVIVTGSKGFVGDVKLRRHPASSDSLAVQGDFTVQVDADHGTAQATIPGKVKGLYAWKDDVVVPADWKGSHVFIDIGVSNLDQFDMCAINSKVIFHPVNWYRPVQWMDITPWVKFGEKNKLTLISRPATKDWKPGDPNYTSITLHRVDAGSL